MNNIRPARKTELKVIQALNYELFVDNNEYDSDLDLTWTKSNKGREYFKDTLNNPNECCLIAEINRKKVGYIIAGPKVSTSRKSKYIEIHNMVVLPEYRSKGIGSMLINACLDWAKSKGFQKAYVNSYFDNKKAIEFYKRNGFSEIDISLERVI